jgi:guanine nucleotide-binding protein subunit alpha
MRLIHRIPFDAREIEHYRQLVFNNLTRGMQALLESMEDMEIKLSEELQEYVEMIENAPDLRDGEPFTMTFYDPLKTLWADENVQKAWERGNEAALPEK